MSNKIPPLTIQQRLFADKWWANGGDCIDAVAFAQYSGYPQPSEKAKKGRQLLASKPIKQYIGYLRIQHKAEQKAQQEKRLKMALEGGYADPKTVGAAAALPDLSLMDDSICHQDLVEGGVGLAGGVVEGSVGVVGEVKQDFLSEPAAARRDFYGPGGLAVAPRVGHGVPSVGGYLPPSAIVPAKTYSPEMQPTEIRELLANIARGNEPSMKDARVRMRALELVMKNLGMLVELAATTNLNTTAGPDIATMTAEQRRAEIAKLEGFLSKAAELVGVSDSM